MLDELKYLRNGLPKLDRINLEKATPELPSIPDVPIRKEPGLFGRANPRDAASYERLLATKRKVTEIEYMQKGMAVITASGRATIVKAVEMMELADEELESGSLAREVGEKLTEVGTQLMAQSHVAFAQHYAEDAISRIIGRK